MARPGTKAAKKRDPRKPAEWSIDDYPYMIYKPNAEHPTYHSSFNKAIKAMTEDINRLATHLRTLDNEAVQACAEAVQQVKKLGPEGGHVNQIVVPYNKMRYMAELVHRRETR